MTRDAHIQLFDLHRANGHGSIEGVHFDFRHESLGENWLPVLAMGLGSACFPDGVSHAARPGKYPVLICPWTTLVECPFIVARRKLSGRALARDIVAHGPHGWVCKGDTISIASVTKIAIEDLPFDAEPDAVLMRVRYLLTRANGARERVRASSIYNHRDSSWGGRMEPAGEEGTASGLTIGAVERRLFSLFRPGDLDLEGEPTERCEEYAARCLDAVTTVSELVRGKAYGDLRDMALVKAGYFLARAEAAALMQPHAERGMKAVEGGAEGGRRRAEARRQWVSEHWEPHAVELALATRAATPAISQSNLAADIHAAWKLNGESPGYDWLLLFVRRLETEGRIPRRVPADRGKGVASTPQRGR